MSLTRDDAGKIAHLHEASGILPLVRDFRDASGGAGATKSWRKEPTVIQTPGRQISMNPFSGRMTGGSGSRTRQVERLSGRGASSSRAAKPPSPQRVSKRQKLDHLEAPSSSKYFPPTAGQRTLRPRPQVGPSTSTSSHRSDPIIIDEDDVMDDTPSKRTESKTSSPDPMDLITPEEVSYAFDQSKPSPICQFSSSFEETRKSPKDGESTARLRSQHNATVAQESTSRLDSDGGGSVPKKASPPSPLRPRSRGKPTAPTEAASRPGKVQTLVTMYNGSGIPHLNLRPAPRKNAMKPKQLSRPALPIQRLDPVATGTSGFISGSGPSKGKATRRDIVVDLPLKQWSIGVVIPAHGVTSEPLFSLVWEPEVLKVQDTSTSILFELQVKRGSLETLRYVDIKKTPISEPIIQIRLSSTAIIHNHTLYKFKFDTSSNGWDKGVYLRVVQGLVEALDSKDGKSILDGPASRSVWEAITRAHEDQPTQSEPEPMLVDIPKENPPDPTSKPRPRPKPRGEPVTTGDFFVRRSARLSGVEQKQYFPRPDPDEVILGYRSGTGSLNITNADVSRLKPGEFLNDTLIEFGLKLWLADLQESNPELASQVHVFSSFFYKKLSTKIPEEGYNSVRKWTSKFDLFQKKYVIVPINENLHWYLAIIYLPEYTLLPRPVRPVRPRPVREVIVHPRRSTRRLGVVVDSLDAKHPEPASRQSLPPDPDPPPNGRVDLISEVIIPESPRTDDQKDEIDVERMVESGGTPVEPPGKQADGQVAAASTDALVDMAVDRLESPTLLYPQSSPLSRLATLSPSHPDIIEERNQPASAGVCEGNTIQPSSIPPTTFYGTKSHETRSVTPQLASIDNSAPAEIEIEEDETMGNADSEPEEIAEHPRTYIYTFDSLTSKHPQAVKRLSRYLLMEAHDKKQLEEDKLTEAKGMQAIVPLQPNYCDCGIYLLHFAKTFMKDPQLHSEIIQSRSSPRKAHGDKHLEHWEEASVGSYREELAARIHSMSEEWKRQRGDQEPATTKNPILADGVAAPQEQASGGPTPAASSKAENDSDSDIEVLGTPRKAPPSRASRRDSDSRRKGPAARVR
ncbi:hypothetical protein BJV78DRAFT_535499 [Lactifluus subvellereus]|nr:hypothetical protein BJV78DRAFT_535499 [Lactifluus subvellereus]